MSEKRLAAVRVAALGVTLAAAAVSGGGQAAPMPPLRIGLVGLDTSHAVQFTSILNDPRHPEHVAGARVVAAFKGGSPDVEASATRIERFTTELTTKWGVELVDSIEALCLRVDAVMLTSVDGRQHLAQARPVFAARKRVFIDKPLAGSFADAREIARLSRESGTPFFSSSSLRFQPELRAIRSSPELGGILGASTHGPCPIHTYVPDLFWYGIHAVEMLYTLMGPGVETVTRVHAPDADVVVGRWKDGRVGVMRGQRAGPQTYGAVAYGRNAILSFGAPRPEAPREPSRSAYPALLEATLAFFGGGVPPVPPEETLEIMAFMEAADRSKARQGAPVALSEVLAPGGPP
ncbi:MAG TPA: Gfo/Idh/MocA family oxidoreductase, partial [Vicinamibacteria bacterium]|nr:Gfo/Idh/MocA family oxidoreductase [Vicinamibacteria bacterium]